MILEISVAVIAFFVVIFVIGLLFVFVQIRRTAKEAEKFLDTSRQQIAPVAHDLAIVMNDMKKIVQSIQSQVGKVEQGVDEFKQIAVRVGEFEKMLEEKIQQPFLELAMMVSALFKALQVLVGFWRK